VTKKSSAIRGGLAYTVRIKPLSSPDIFGNVLWCLFYFQLSEYMNA